MKTFSFALFFFLKKKTSVIITMSYFVLRLRKWFNDDPAKLLFIIIATKLEAVAG